jgi:hypothetical protein
MVTGLEPMLGPPIVKAAGAGVSRAAGWGFREFTQGRRRKKIRTLVRGAPNIDLNSLDALDSRQLKSLVGFLESREFEHLAISLSQAYLLEKYGQRDAGLLTNLQQELSSLLALWMPSERAHAVGDIIFAALAEAVSVHSKDLLDTPKLNPSLEAQLIKTIGSISAASVRNTSMLKRIDELSGMSTFVKEYTSQVVALHRTMRLPHAGTTRQVPYQQLFVQPGLLVVGEESRSPADLAELFEYSTRVVILGDPGGGKSTLSLKFIYDLAASIEDGKAGYVPFLVTLRDYAKHVRGADRRTLLQYLSDLCRSPYNVEPPDRSLEYLLLNNRAMASF